jgi:hypothetical protein
LERDLSLALKIPINKPRIEDPEGGEDKYKNQAVRIRQ